MMLLIKTQNTKKYLTKFANKFKMNHRGNGICLKDKQPIRCEDWEMGQQVENLHSWIPSTH